MGNNSSNDKNKTIIRENKGPKKIQIKRTKLEEKIMINWNWRMKLKINKTSKKRPILKIKNQKNKNKIWNINNKKDQVIIF
jgi:hypothetical protein